MYIPEFEYHRPSRVQEACALLASLEGRVAALGGGTEILIELKSGEKRFDHLVALDGIERLRVIEMEGGDLVIGAMVTPGALARSSLVCERFPEVAEVTRVFAARQVGNRATIGGNVAAAVPSADFPPILIALGATCSVAGPAGERLIPLEDAFAGPRRNSLAKGELITDIRLPPKPPRTGAAYVKFGLRGAGVCAVAGAAASISLDGETCRAARIVLGAVAPMPLLVARASDYLAGRRVDQDAIEGVARIAHDTCQPISDIRGSAEYRRDLVGTLTARALRTALERARASAQPGTVDPN